MEILLVLLVIVVIILLISINNKTSEQREFIYSLEQKIKELNEYVRNLSLTQPTKEKSKAEDAAIEKPTAIKPPVVEGIKKDFEELKEEEPSPKVNLQKQVPEPTIAYNIPPPDLAIKKTQEAIPEETTRESAWEKMRRNNPDLEKFIGENLANKIGIAVLVLGIAFFVKYAIDKEWINEIGRVVIGLVAGGLLIGLAHRTRKSYRSFSSVLVGGGLTVFYFTIAFAFHQYHLMSQSAAFSIMVLITAFAVVLSLLYDRIELAILATLGGFVTPFLVTTGQDNYIALFTYLSILNTGLMVMAFFKRWRAINYIALFFTVLIYGGWLTNRLVFTKSVFPTWNAFAFASIFYLQFLLMNVLNNIRHNRIFGALDFIAVFSINSLYYAAGMVILQQWEQGKYQGLFTSLLGVFNFIIAWYFFKRKQMDKNFIYLLIGLTITFISLAAPVQLKGNYITLFWAAETVVLFWLFQRSRIALIKVFSAIVMFLMFISLTMDWGQVYYFSNQSIPILLNRGFTTTIAAAMGLFIYYQMMRKEADWYFFPDVTNKFVRSFLLASSVILLFIAGAQETTFQFANRYPTTDIYILYLHLYTFLFANVVLVVFKKPGYVRLTITILCFVFYLFYLNSIHDITYQLLTTGANRVHFWAHWISALLLLKLLYDQVMYIRANSSEYSNQLLPFTWIISGAFVLLFSIEFYHLQLWVNGADADSWDYWENLYYKAGLSIIWGICSFIMMWLGMRYKFAPLRVVALTLITVTLGKLFIYDIRNIPPGGKIAAFILLGVLLLVISFMYQRLKRIIVDDQLEKK